MLEMEKARREERMERHGLLIVHTGDGKGKTTAAMGLAVRAWGDGLRVLILQFIKGGWQTGERHAIEVLARAEGRIELRPLGLGFTRKGEKPKEEHRRAAEAALKMEVHLVCTGRAACPLLLERADLITEMRSLRHPFAAGIKAQKGIEF